MSYWSRMEMSIQIESNVEEEEGHDENEDKDGILEWQSIASELLRLNNRGLLFYR